MIAYIGIDPGITGAFALVSDSGYWVRDVHTYPVDSKGKRDYDFYQMYKSLGSLTTMYDKVLISLEKQQAMPKQGVSSTFATGRGYGAWEALCWATTPDFQIVSPRKWKKALGLTSDKEVSRLKAISLYPSLEPMLKRKRDHNRAEALLLAHYTKLERNNLV